MFVLSLCLVTLALTVVYISGYSDALPVGFAIGGCIVALACYLLYVGFSRRFRESISNRTIVLLLGVSFAAVYLVYSLW